jgi:hypothetical protein
MLSQCSASTKKALADANAFAAMRAFYQDTPTLRVPPVIRLYNYVSDEWKDVTLISPD